MFKLEKVLSLTLLVLINFGDVVCDFSDLMSLLKTVDEQPHQSCIYTISAPGEYTYQHHPRLTTARCEIRVEVPEGSIGYVRPSERTCEITSSANFTQMCNSPRQESNLAAGVHHIVYDASETVSFRVDITPIIKTTCNTFMKDVYLVNGATIILLNNLSKGACLLRLPPSLSIQILEFTPVKHRKCCPEVVMGSGTFHQNPLDFSQGFNACLATTTAITYESRCRNSYVYLRRAKPNETLTIRAIARSKEWNDECSIGNIPSDEDSRYHCHHNPLFN